MAEATKERKQRTVEKAEYRIQRQVDGQKWEELHDGDPRTPISFDDVKHGVSYIRQHELEGQFRIVRICRIVTAKKETRAVMKIE